MQKTLVLVALTTLALVVTTACQDKSAAAAPPSAEAKPDAAPNANADTPGQPTVVKGPMLTHTVEDIDGKKVDLASYRGKALLIVNTASECGFTPQYANLEEIYRTYKDRGLEVLAFPSNDFGGQEPGDAAQIKNFTAENFEITFPLFAKVHARGPEIDPLYKTLSEETPNGIRGEVKWNFTKFLVDPEGRVVARFESRVKPDDEKVKDAIERVLPEKT